MRLGTYSRAAIPTYLQYLGTVCTYVIGEPVRLSAAIMAAHVML